MFVSIRMVKNTSYAFKDDFVTFLFERIRTTIKFASATFRPYYMFEKFMQTILGICFVQSQYDTSICVFAQDFYMSIFVLLLLNLKSLFMLVFIGRILVLPPIFLDYNALLHFSQPTKYTKRPYYLG